MSGPGSCAFRSEAESHGNRPRLWNLPDRDDVTANGPHPGLPVQSAVANAIALDATGDLFIAGAVLNPGFPSTPGVLQPTSNAGTDAFLTKLDPHGALLLSTFLGGDGDDSATSVSIDSMGDIVLSGTTSSSDFPDRLGQFPAGPSFVAQLDSGASKLLYSMRLPGRAVDEGLNYDAAAGAITAAGSAGLISRIHFSSPPNQTLLGAGNAATSGLGGGIAPGTAISLYGFTLGPAAAVSATASQGVLPLQLAGVQVFIGDLPAPLLYVSPSQINAIVPDTFTPLPASVNLKVTYNGQTVGQLPLALQPYAPQIFRHTDGTAIVINQDGTLNSPSNPAPAGSIVASWGTGIFISSEPGSIATQACNQLGATFTANVELVYLGCAPGAAEAVFQMNFKATAGAISVSAGGVASEPFSIYVKP
jgi:uncharacterized protein (TIGR03437 family)